MMPGYCAGPTGPVFAVAFGFAFASDSYRWNGLDNFSFIEVPSAVAQSAIDRISGETLNGRRVNVDYARSKKSGWSSAPSTTDRRSSRSATTCSI